MARAASNAETRHARAARPVACCACASVWLSRDPPVCAPGPQGHALWGPSSIGALTRGTVGARRVISGCSWQRLPNCGRVGSWTVASARPSLAGYRPRQRFGDHARAAGGREHLDFLTWSASSRRGTRELPSRCRRRGRSAVGARPRWAGVSWRRHARTRKPGRRSRSMTSIWSGWSSMAPESAGTARSWQRRSRPISRAAAGRLGDRSMRGIPDAWAISAVRRSRPPRHGHSRAGNLLGCAHRPLDGFQPGTIRQGPGGRPSYEPDQTRERELALRRVGGTVVFLRSVKLSPSLRPAADAMINFFSRDARVSSFLALVTQ